MSIDDVCRQCSSSGFLIQKSLSLSLSLIHVESTCRSLADSWRSIRANMPQSSPAFTDCHWEIGFRQAPIAADRPQWRLPVNRLAEWAHNWITANYSNQFILSPTFCLCLACSLLPGCFSAKQTETLAESLRLFQKFLFQLPDSVELVFSTHFFARSQKL